MRMKAFLISAGIAALTFAGCNNNVFGGDDASEMTPPPPAKKMPLGITFKSSTLSVAAGGEVHFYLDRELTTEEYTSGVTLHQVDTAAPNLVGVEKVLPLSFPQEYKITFTPHDIDLFHPGPAYIQVETVDGKVTMDFTIN